MIQNLKKDIIEHLKRKGNYVPDVYNYVIDMLLENIKYAEEAQANLNDNGLVISTTGGNGFTTTKLNPALNAYQMCLRNIHQCSAKLGINRNDRLKLKLIEEKEKDDFDKIINS